jgi:hypothetical protein
MPIKRMIDSHGGYRELQARQTVVGKIRAGIFNPEGRGRPEKLGTFRLTARDEAVIRTIAEMYGGDVEQWRPQGSTGKSDPQWQVITDTNALPVLVPTQPLDPNYEAWGAGRTCIRRCDGEWNSAGEGGPCVCNGPEDTRPRQRDLCKITIRAFLSLSEIPGFGVWMYESHGENTVAELMNPLLLSAVRNPEVGPVPAIMRLRPETRRTWSLENHKFETRNFYVTWFDVSAVSAAQVLAGGAVLGEAIDRALGTVPGAREVEAPVTRPAIEAAGTPELATEGRPAIEQSPPPAELPSVTLDAQAVAEQEQRVRTILAAIEQKSTVAEMDELKAKLQARGVKDERVRQAWRSRYDAIVERDRIEAQAARTAESRAMGQRHVEESLNIMRDQERMKRHHDKSWLDPEAKREAVLDGRDEYRIGDEVTVGGMTFTKIADPDTDPFGPGGGAPEEPPADWPPVLDAEEVPGDRGGTDDVAGPDGQTRIAGYDLEFELNRVWLEGGKRGQTTTQTYRLITEACGVAKVPDLGPQHATALHTLADGLADGSVLV